MSQAANQRLGNIDLDQYMKDLNNKNPDLTAAAAKALKENPALQGTDLNQVATWLKVIMDKAAKTKTPEGKRTDMSAMAATHVLYAALRPDEGWNDITWGWDAASNYKFDEGLVDKTLREINSGDVAGRAAVARDTESDRDSLLSNLKALEAAEKDLESIRQADAAGNPVSQKVRNDATAALSKALKRVEDINGALNQKQRPALIPNAATQAELDRIQREKYFKGIPPVFGSASAATGGVTTPWARPVENGVTTPWARPVGNGTSAAQALQDALRNRPPVQR